MSDSTSILDRVDGWFSSLTGFGVSGRDKRESVDFRRRELNRSQIEDLWRSNDLAARVIETVPKESLRRGFTLSLEDKSLAEDVTGLLEEHSITSSFLQAKYFQRAYGGSAIYPVINDGQSELGLPLNLERIPKISHSIVLEPRELTPVSYYDKLTDKKYGFPKLYRLNPYVKSGTSITQLIHESRLIIFHGINVSRAQMSINQWGDSILNRCHEILRDYGIAWSAASALLHDFSQAVMKIKGLHKLMAADKDDVVKARIRSVELARSTIGATLIDSEEDYGRVQTPISGLPELLDRMATRVAAAADMPVTLLMGQSPAGLNATGESDIRFFYDRIMVEQNLGIKPQLEQMLKLFLLSKDSPTKGVEPDNWSVEFQSLWQPSDKEIADTRKVVADTDKVNIEMGIVTPEEVAISRFGGDTYSYETVIDQAIREEFESIDDEDVAAETTEPVELVDQDPEVAKTAMNGAQVGSLINVVQLVGTKQLSRESAIGILKVAFQLDTEEAEKVLGPADFVPEEVAEPEIPEPEVENPGQEEEEEEELQARRPSEEEEEELQ